MQIRRRGALPAVLIRIYSFILPSTNKLWIPLPILNLAKIIPSKRRNNKVYLTIPHPTSITTTTRCGHGNVQYGFVK